MWSVWSETAELYLGPTVAMLRLPGKDTVVVEHMESLPVDQLLGGVSRQVAKQGIVDANRARRLRIVLSGALCPALTFVAPKQVTRWTERMEIARATAAMAMGTTPDQVVCEMDTARPGLASAITIHTMSTLQDWTARHSFKVTSIQPLWAIASQSRTASQAAVKALMVVDPDAITVVADDGVGKLVASTQPGQVSASDEQAHTRRLLVGLGLRESDLLKLAFGPAARTVMRCGPASWPNSWYSR